jgi:ABC-2 type transport system ATP-binding protein
MSRHPQPPRHPRPSRRDPAVVEKLGALVATGLGKDYGDQQGLDPVDLRVELHQRVALVGHNGSGKTTLLRLAAGLLEPTSGTVEIHGFAAGSLPARRVCAYLSDHPTFYDDLSMWEHLEYVARLHGVADWQQLAADLLGLLGLYERADDLPGHFSRGLRQKAAIALAFVRPFEVLLVDEPFVGLDSTGKEALVGLLDQAGEDGATLVVATHELSYVERVDRVVGLRDGGLAFDGRPSDIDVDALVRNEWAGAVDEVPNAVDTDGGATNALDDGDAG